nr:DUF1707 domain-containing protein [Micromonospora mirobrigensis]
MRAADRDREAVVVRLGAAAGEGRLSLAEFEARSGQAYVARTYGELETRTSTSATGRWRCSDSSAARWVLCCKSSGSSFT